MKYSVLRVAKIVVAIGIFLPFGAVVARSQQTIESNIVQGSLFEVKDKRRVLLHVARTQTIDTRDLSRSVIEEAYGSEPKRNRRFIYAFVSIAKKLNEYARKYRSLGAVERAADADFIIFFNLLEYRRSLGTHYPYGEMFVILNQPPGSTTPPRIIWKTDRILWAEDAAKKLLKDLKRARGEH